MILSIAICQLAGIIGAFFTTPAIPTWYVGLVKPSFNPPSWLFGPVWTLLYTLMGISLYKIWLKKSTLLGKKKSEAIFAIKIFGIHLALNSLWSIIFFGFKNPQIAFFEIVVLWTFIIYVIKLFWKIEKISGILLLPYLVWVSFAMVLNFSIWTLNPKPLSVFAQEFNYQKSYSDYTFTKDKYNSALTDFNKKKDSFLKNQTLSLKEEARISLYDLLLERNNLITTYLTSLRLRLLESKGLSPDEKTAAISLISEEFKWFENHKNNFLKEDSLEDLISKSTEEDIRLSESTTPAINYSLVSIGYDDISTKESEHLDIYNSLKDESNELVALGRADSSLFERWFSDIEGEINNLDKIEDEILLNLEGLSSSESYSQKKAFKDSLEGFTPAKESLLKINQYLSELENVIEEKR